MLTHGLAGELRDDGIGCNTLWPRSYIATAAVKNKLGGEKSIDGSRTPDIVADAAHVILTSDAKMTTDNFFMDDEVLISNGATVDNLEKYRLSKGAPLNALIPDGFC